MIRFPRAIVLAVAVLFAGQGFQADAASVALGGRQLLFSPPQGWAPSAHTPDGLLALFKPPGAERFPHLAVSEAEGGDARTTLARVRKSLPTLYRELSIDNPRPLLSPTIAAGPGPARVEYSFSGEIGGRAFDWYQCIVPVDASGAMFTFAFPRGSLQSWRPALDVFFRSLQLAPRVVER